MRKFMVLPMAALLILAVAAPVSAGPNVSNTSGGGTHVDGSWYSDGGFGYMSISQETGQPGGGDIYAESGDYVECSTLLAASAAQPAPDDTGGGGEFGFVGTRTYGWIHDATITIGSRMATGSATGQVELATETVDECAGTGDVVFETATLSVELTGVGDVVMFRGSGSSQIPSEFNGHYNYRGKARQATGSVLAGSVDAVLDQASMQQMTWSEHVNN